MSDRDSGLVTFILGALVGAAVAVLYAPQSGKDTRKHLRRLSEDLSDTVSEIGEDLKAAGCKLYEDGRERVSDAKERFVKTFDKEIKAVKDIREKVTE